jgi:hypothetical protein
MLLTITKILAYHTMEFITAVKSSLIQVPGAFAMKHFIAVIVVIS